MSEHGQIEAIKAAKHRNIWTDTSSSSSMQNKLIEYVYSQIGADRIMFGTDTNHAGAFRGRIEYALIPDEVKYKILREDAEKLFGKYINK